MSKARRIVLATLPLALAAGLVGCAPDDPDEPHFAYSGAEGPKHWGELSSSWKTCSTGTEQSPIALTGGGSKTAQDLALDYPDEVAFDSDDNGHTVQVTPQGDASVTSDGVRYALDQLHFHVPSEHEINGEKAAAEFHFVHKAESGDLLVVGVLAREGAASEAWAPFVDAAASPKHDARGTRLDLGALLPKKLDHFSYDGSLTTPPCTEGVRWRVLKSPIEVSAEQLAQLRSAHEHNSRPLQPLQGRSVLEAD